MPGSPHGPAARSTLDWRRHSFNAVILLVLVSVIVYVLQLFEDGLVDQLALPGDPSEVWERPWTVVTVMFLHEHPLHLVLMLAVLVVSGAALEQAVGPRVVVGVYLASGVAGAVAFVAAASFVHVEDPAVGSSAAVLGLAATFIALRPAARFAGATSRQWLAVIVVASVALSVATPASSAAHLAGVAVGLLTGWLLRTSSGLRVRTGAAPRRRLTSGESTPTRRS